MHCAKFCWNWPTGSGKDNFKFCQCIFTISKLSPLEKERSPSFSQTLSPSPKNACFQVWLKLAQWFWGRRFLKFIIVFSQFRNYLTLEKGGALHLNKLESPSPKDALCQVLLFFAKWFWRRK